MLRYLGFMILKTTQVNWQSRCLLLSYGGYNKLPQTRWFKTTEIYSFTLLEARSPKLISRHQGVGRVLLPPEALGGECVLASSSFWWRLAFLGLWQQYPNLCLRGHTAFSSVCVKSPSASLSLFLKEFLYFYYLFIYLFIFGCVGSSFLCKGFL